MLHGLILQLLLGLLGVILVEDVTEVALATANAVASVVSSNIFI